MQLICLNRIVTNKKLVDKMCFQSLDGPTISLPTERGNSSVSISKGQLNVIAIEAVIVLLLHNNCSNKIICRRKKKHRETERAISFSLNVQHKMFLLKVKVHCCYSVVM